MNGDLDHEGLIAAARAEIAQTIGDVRFDPEAPLIRTLSAMMALTRSHVTMGMVDTSVEADVRMHPIAPVDGPAADILDEMRECANELMAGRRDRRFDASVPIDQAGFAAFAASMAGQPDGVAAIDRLAELVGRTIGSISAAYSGISSEHYRNVLSRDLGIDRSEMPHVVRETTRWALRLDMQGSAARADAMLRRMQALRAYGAVHPLLMTDGMTDIVDRGERLAPALQKELGIDAARLRLVTGAQPIERTLKGTECVASIRELLAYDVPSHEWPREWENFRFGSAHHQTLVSPKLIVGQESVDALAAFTTDVLKPLAKSRIEALGLADPMGGDLSAFLGRLAFPDRMRRSEARRDFHRGMTAAIFGARRAKAFHEGAEIWHRRAACAAALRKEMLAEDPHWPALCDVWTAPDGGITAVPLTTAEELVQEGNFHRHCVGGYYEQCRSGRTHIVSMRRDGVPVGTLELISVFTDGKLDHLTPGQFETTGRAKPDQDVQIAARSFLKDLEGNHPVRRREIQKHARRMARMRDDGWSEQIMPMEHAVRTWPLYRPLMPRPFVEDLAEWAERSGLTKTIDDAVVAIADVKVAALGLAA